MLYRVTILVFAAVLVLAGCADEPDAREIIARARTAHGSDILDEAVVEFDFRGKQFAARRMDGAFTYTRAYRDSTGSSIREVLANDTLYQTLDGIKNDLSAQEHLRIETAVNSVVYFALLPYNLADPAVQAQYLDSTTIEGEPYYEIEVTFQQEGGGRAWEDRFVYWIHQDKHTMDYLAYDYQTGTRFRKAINPRVVEGVRFADYLNFTSDSVGTAIEDYDDAMAAGELRKISEIRVENVDVRPLQ